MLSNKARITWGFSVGTMIRILLLLSEKLSADKSTKPYFHRYIINRNERLRYISNKLSISIEIEGTDLLRHLKITK